MDIHGVMIVEGEDDSDFCKFSRFLIFSFRINVVLFFSKIQSSLTFFLISHLTLRKQVCQALHIFCICDDSKQHK